MSLCGATRLNAFFESHQRDLADGLRGIAVHVAQFGVNLFGSRSFVERPDFGFRKSFPHGTGKLFRIGNEHLACPLFAAQVQGYHREVVDSPPLLGTTTK